MLQYSGVILRAGSSGLAVLAERAIPEERSVAKILVADDNSNIQKMVGLALKDQGIDVVAVGNGEAAVRKISDVRPDLVLADVFMPVRNGYEVCKYVKDDSALSHIPVILLVGAFDPLDEQEAQRVGADGVLKKPFVPPDPLISMVKSALTRSGVSYSGAPAEKPEPAPVAAADMIAPRAPSAAPEAPKFDEIPEPVMKKPEPLQIDASAPPAFGSLLETPAAEEEDLGYAVPVQPATERNWGASDEDEEETEEDEEEEKPQAAWRAASDATGDDDVTAGARDWRDTAFGDSTGGRKHSSRGWEPSHEKRSLTDTVEEVLAESQEARPLPPPIPISETKPSPSVSAFAQEVTSAPSTPEPASVSPVQEMPPPRTEPVSSSIPLPAPMAFDAPAAQTFSQTSIGTSVAVEEPAVEEPAAPAKAERSEAAKAEPAKTEPANSWFATAPSPWETEVRKASQLASTWDAPATTQGAPEHAAEKTADFAEAEAPAAESEASPAASAYAQHSEFTETVIAKAEEAGLSSYAVEAIREEVAEVTDGASAAAIPASTEPVKAAEPAAEATTDELVAKVLAKMSPEVLQAVTREILKPVVEAIVRDELHSKKS